MYVYFVILIDQYGNEYYISIYYYVIKINVYKFLFFGWCLLCFICKLYIVYFFVINCWKILFFIYLNGVFWVYYIFEVNWVFKNIYNFIFLIF